MTSLHRPFSTVNLWLHKISFLRLLFKIVEVDFDTFTKKICSCCFCVFLFLRSCHLCTQPCNRSSMQFSFTFSAAVPDLKVLISFLGNNIFIENSNIFFFRVVLSDPQRVKSLRQNKRRHRNLTHSEI